MEINKQLVQMMLVSSKNKVESYMEQVENHGITATQVCEIDKMHKMQKQLVESIKDKLYISFLETIYEFAKEQPEDSIINFFIFHPNMWNEDTANCFIYIQTNNGSPIDIDSRVKIYDGVYPSGVGGFEAQTESNFQVEHKSYNPSKQIETISSEVLSKLENLLKGDN